MKTLKKLRIVLFTLLVILFMTNCEKSANENNCKVCEVRYYWMFNEFSKDITDTIDADGDDKADAIECYTLCNDELSSTENNIEVISITYNMGTTYILYKKLVCK